MTESKSPILFQSIFKALRLLKVTIFRKIIFIFFGLVLIVLLFSFTDVLKVVDLLVGFPLRVNFLLFLVLAFYFLIKFQMARFLISKLGIGLSWQKIALVFSIGELAREIPIGPGAFLLFLTKPQAQSFFPLKLFAAPIVQISVDIFIVFSILLLLGVANFPLVRPFALAGISIIVVLALLVKKFSLPNFVINFGQKSGILPRTVQAGVEIKKGIEELLNLKTLLFASFISFGYLTTWAFLLFFISQATGFGLITIRGAFSTIALIYLAAILSPLPIDLGVMESAGFGVLIAWGATKEAALATMLIFRTILFLSSWMIFVIIYWLLREEIDKIVREVSSQS